MLVAHPQRSTKYQCGCTLSVLQIFTLPGPQGAGTKAVGTIDGGGGGGGAKKMLGALHTGNRPCPLQIASLWASEADL